MNKSEYLIKMRPGNHILVLGASGGIGSETVLALAANGAEVITIGYGSNKKAADQLRKQVEAWGVRAFTVQVDRSSYETVTLAVEAAVENASREITDVVDAIGISPNIPFADLELEDADKVWHVNVRGCLASTKVLAERMARLGIPGTFVLFGSTNGINSYSAQSLPYDLSKQNVHGIVESLAEEYAPAGIRFLGVAPGWINTGMNETLPRGMLTREVKLIYMGRQGMPLEVGKLVTSMLMDSHSYVTGAVIKVDGGYPRRNPVRRTFRSTSKRRRS